MRVYTIIRDGRRCALESIGDVLSDLESDLHDSEGGIVVFPSVEVSEMTREEYDSLPEFDGW